MPHLDVCTFIAQYNWTMITLSSLYLCSLIGLPGIARVLHLRASASIGSASANTGVSAVIAEANAVSQDTDVFVATMLKPVA
uniref:ATP synthase F0 subunit 8 n=1 Tax=Amoebidium parasiticum TaxID=4881 RepID=Q8M0C5_AMOPA|nr:ATP synthase F0 subunit 8 [Amoebidium parasiticum]